MTLAIIILVYLMFLGDVFKIFKIENNDSLISGALVTLVSWQQSTAWGITMCCISALMIVLFYVAKKNDY